MPLIPATYTSERAPTAIFNRYRAYVDPTNYQDPNAALIEFTNEISPAAIEVTRTIGVGEFGEAS